MKWLHPSFWVAYDKSTYPTVADAQQAIERYCRENGHTCRFLDDDTVEIDGVPHEIYRGAGQSGKLRHQVPKTVIRPKKTAPV